MPVATHSIVFARIVPSELNIVTAENNNVIDLALQRQIKNATGNDIWQDKTALAEGYAGTDFAGANLLLKWSEFQKHFYDHDGGLDGRRHGSDRYRTPADHHADEQRRDEHHHHEWSHRRSPRARASHRPWIRHSHAPHSPKPAACAFCPAWSSSAFHAYGVEPYCRSRA